ncbi:MAG: tetratricopeptide repeat protein [Anaerolineales bacterium]|jgi:tetratricopeptide (TPR) repeat protein
MSDEILWNEIGNIYLKFGSPKDAIAAFTKAIELNPESGWGYCSLGNAYLLTEEFGQALFQFRKSLQLMDTPENQAAVWNKIGDAYRALKDIDNAIQAYKKADALDMGASPADRKEDKKPGDLSSFREIIKCEKMEAEPNILSSTLEKTATLSEKSLDFQAKDNMFEPVKDKKESMEIIPPTDPTDTKPIYVQKTSINDDQFIAPSPDDKQQNVPQNAREGENEVIPRERPLIVIPEPTGMVEIPPNESAPKLAPHQIKNSQPVRVEAKSKDGKSKGVRSNIGPGTDDLEEILAKVNIYENITRVNPTSDRGWDTLGKLYKALGRYKDAIGAYQKAIEVAPDKEVYYYYLGLLFSVEQQNEEAIQAFQFVLRKNPDYVLAHSALAGVYHRMGLENKANHHISIALPKMNNESTYNRACFYVICGDHDLAFEFLRLALTNRETTIDWIKSDPDLDPIRADQRYVELISEEDQPAPEHGNENYFSSELEGKHNKLLPILNHSLTR